MQKGIKGRQKTAGIWKVLRLTAGTSKDPIKKQNKNENKTLFESSAKKRKALFKNLILTWSPGCVYWNNLKSIIKTMFYHFPSRLVTSYKLDHLTHLSCTWNSHWNPAILIVQRKITFQSPAYIFFWFILLIFCLDQNSNSLVFLQAHIWATSIIVLGNDFFPFDIRYIQYTTWSTPSQATASSPLWAGQEHC